MTIKEKAKRYDELLVKLQEAKADNSICDERYCCVIDDIVPELKESEDERIRKSIIAIINNYVDNSNTFKPKMIAWLEKQSEEARIEALRTEYEKGRADAFAEQKVVEMKSPEESLGADSETYLFG